MDSVYGINALVEEIKANLRKIYMLLVWDEFEFLEYRQINLGENWKGFY